MANPYRELLTTPGVGGLVIASSVARLPQAMIGIGIITMLVQQSGHYWLAGAVAGIFTLANALMGPQVSKLVDRLGQNRVLPWVTAFSITMLLVLITAAHMRAPVPLLCILAMLAGTMPSMPAMIRARWTHLFRGKPQLHTAFSLDTVLTELTFVIGPPLSIGLSTGIAAEAGPLAAIVLLVIGVTAFLLQRQTAPKVIKNTTEHRGSTLRIPGLGTIVLALLAMGVIGGSIDVAVVAFANAQGWPTAASLILAAYALGSMVAGLAFGAIRVTLPIERQFFIGVLLGGNVRVAAPVCGRLHSDGDHFRGRYVLCTHHGCSDEPWHYSGTSVQAHRRADMDDHRHQHWRGAGCRAGGADHRRLWRTRRLRHRHCCRNCDDGYRASRPTYAPRGFDAPGGSNLLLMRRQPGYPWLP